ncbi:hypothetical protein BpHYR1_032390 [Brachionus plicatilis]|uniref:Uncharacterized protein n=1 Tax=Brachionus plicatilis TaxID=10195 RepID=A0A3M7PFB3_BRAPC|nr:hypothetical protein BpHYR1_032390 [Brachionus plicatilis]
MILFQKIKKYLKIIDHELLDNLELIINNKRNRAMTIQMGDENLPKQMQLYNFLKEQLFYKAISFSKTIKFLGLFFDEDFSFKKRSKESSIITW